MPKTSSSSSSRIKKQCLYIVTCVKFIGGKQSLGNQVKTTVFKSETARNFMGSIADKVYHSRLNSYSAAFYEEDFLYGTMEPDLFFCQHHDNGNQIEMGDDNDYRCYCNNTWETYKLNKVQLNDKVNESNLIHSTRCGYDVILTLDNTIYLFASNYAHDTIIRSNNISLLLNAKRTHIPIN